MSTNNSNKPKLRFKGFSDDWEQRKLGEVATFINGRAYSQDELLHNGKYKVLRVGNFYTNDSWYYSDMELDEKYYANDGDLLYTWSATFGPHIWNGGKVIYHYHIWKVDLSDMLEKRFAVQLLEQDKAKILSDKNGSTMVHITKSGMEQKEVLLPSSVAEQTRIGAYFENLDNLITLHQRKCDNLKIIKKSMLNNLFPKIGGKVPKWRFKGFNNDWEQRKLDSISEIKTGPFGSTLHADDYVTDGIPIITTEHFKNGDLPTSKNGLPQVSDEDYKRLSPYVLNEGDIVFSRVGSVDINALVIPSQRHWLFSGRVLRVRPDMTNDSQFLHTVLETETIKADIRSRAVGQTMPSINTEILNETLVMMPQLRAEQEQIGQFFYSLNKTITLHQSEVERLKKVKQFFLKKMFV